MNLINMLNSFIFEKFENLEIKQQIVCGKDRRKKGK